MLCSVRDTWAAVYEVRVWLYIGVLSHFVEVPAKIPMTHNSWVPPLSPSQRPSTIIRLKLYLLTSYPFLPQPDFQSIKLRHILHLRWQMCSPQISYGTFPCHFPAKRLASISPSSFRIAGWKCGMQRLPIELMFEGLSPNVCSIKQEAQTLIFNNIDIIFITNNNESKYFLNRTPH